MPSPYAYYKPPAAALCCIRILSWHPLLLLSSHVLLSVGGGAVEMIVGYYVVNDNSALSFHRFLVRSLHGPYSLRLVSAILLTHCVFLSLWFTSTNSCVRLVYFFWFVMY